MIYPNITDQLTRDAAVRQLARWHRNQVASMHSALRYVKSQSESLRRYAVADAELHANWIFGFKRALDIMNNP